MLNANKVLHNSNQKAAITNIFQSLKVVQRSDVPQKN